MRPIILLSFLLLGMSLLAQTQGDNLRAETRLDQVYQQYNLSGEGVIVAMIERGIDYQHPDFVDENGNTRIAYIYDMVDQAGANAPNNPYGIGTIYDRAAIDQALDTGTPLATVERFGHGTACTGLAAGDGSAMPGAPYRGAAPGATIISVKVTQDGFPAIGNIAGQSGFFNPAYLPTALQFVKDKAAALGLPVVALLNLGSIGGPTDGSSDISRAMADFDGPGQILVCGVGDDGGNDNRAADTLAQGETSELRIQKAEAGNLRFEAWYAGDDRLEVSLVLPNGTVFGPYASPATNTGADQQSGTGFTYYHRGSETDFSNADNGQRQILIDINGAPGTYLIRLTGSTINSDGSLFASLNPSLYANDNRFLNQVFPGASINDYASAQNIIVPTDYVYDSTYVDLNGVPRDRNGQGAEGDLWAGSSAGPTLDGRLGVDIAVPGELNIGAYSPDTYYSQFSFNIIEGSNGLYGLQNAVSAAAPILTGVIALMLEVNPILNTSELRSLLHQTARSDAYTGAVPNPRWGHGKLDALAAIEATQATVGIPSAGWSQGAFSYYPNPTSERLFYRWEGHEPAQVAWLDVQGRLLTQQSIQPGGGEMEVPVAPPGLYLLRLRTAAGGLTYGRVLIR
jgi:hypothetical protein